MKYITCQTMRESVLVATALLGLGILIQLVSKQMIVQSGMLPSLLTWLGFSLQLSSPLVILAVVAASLLPPVRRRLEHCNH